ncbi:nitrogen fixation protein FixA [Acidihalobacter aeolianus]|uniref:Protein FixA n=1 Tax=Acidihalobacter aeolianus TaxID=2792603 RepID=A0A1D8KCD6_9GAMM|nr:electron transfer flavoprotein subunit beta/FixA family protein [Acidihalobacter aeolianus]AOV18625.1 nitrogen fixation protein FixA [Acidihalobacter aeolianus]
MHIVVCIKQVPDSAQIRIHPVTNTIMRQGVPAIVNPYDLFALEEALRVRDRLGGRVTVLTMGPPTAEAALRKALSIGADDAVLLTDRMFAGSDTLATSFALSTAIRKLNDELPVDIVITGKQTIDGDTAQVGPGIAIRLGFNLLTYVSQIEDIDLEARRIRVHRRAEGGVQVIDTPMPCLITLLEGVNTLRHGSLPDMFRAARAEVRRWSRQDAGIEDPSRIGLKGSPTVVTRVFAPKPSADPAEQMEVEGRGAGEIAVDMVERLFAEHAEVERLIHGHA